MLFCHEPIQKLIRYADVFLISFDQCAYGLQIAGTNSYDYIKKSTDVAVQYANLV